MTDFTFDSIPAEHREPFYRFLIDKWLPTAVINQKEYDEFKRPAAYPETTPEPETETCCVCLTEDATKLCPKGGHHYACDDCYEKLRLGTDARCPVCRASGVVDINFLTPPTPAPVPPTSIYEERQDLRQGDLYDYSNYRAYRYQPFIPILPYPVWTYFEGFVMNLVNYMDSKSEGHAFRNHSAKFDVGERLACADPIILRDLVYRKDLIILVEKRYGGQWGNIAQENQILFGVKSGSMFKFYKFLNRATIASNNPLYTKRVSTIIRDAPALDCELGGQEKFFTKRVCCSTTMIFSAPDMPWSV